MEKEKKKDSNKFEYTGDEQENLHYFLSLINEKNKNEILNFRTLIYLIVLILTSGILTLFIFGIDIIVFMLILIFSLIYFYFNNRE